LIEVSLIAAMRDERRTPNIGVDVCEPWSHRLRHFRRHRLTIPAVEYFCGLVVTLFRVAESEQSYCSSFVCSVSRVVLGWL